MNKKQFIKNRPFDEIDAAQMQDWIELNIQELTKYVYYNGIVSGLGVTLNAGMTLTIGLGKAIDVNYKFISVPTNQSVTIANGHATLGRYDLVTVKYNTSLVNNADTADKYGQGTGFIYSKNILDSFIVEVIPGIPASSPIAPVLPAGSILLAQVFVPATATTILAPNIVDKRTYINLIYTSTLAPKDSPALTGVPTAPTAAEGTNTTQIATTAYVLANGSGKFASYENQFKLTAAASNVNIGIAVFNSATDTLQVFEGGIKLTRDVEWKLNANNTSIDRFDGTNWNSGTIFDFVVFKNIAKAPTGDIDGTMLIDNSVGIAKLSPALQASVTDITRLGLFNTDINKVKSLTIKIDTRDIVPTWNNGLLTKIEEKDGVTVVSTTIYTYDPNSVLTQKEVTAGGTTVIYTYTYDPNGVWTKTSKVVG